MLLIRRSCFHYLLGLLDSLSFLNPKYTHQIISSRAEGEKPKIQKPCQRIGSGIVVKYIYDIALKSDQRIEIETTRRLLPDINYFLAILLENITVTHNIICVYSHVPVTNPTPLIDIAMNVFILLSENSCISNS